MLKNNHQFLLNIIRISIFVVRKQDKPAGKNSEHSSNSGAVGGGVTGGIFFVTLIAIVLYFVRRKIRRKRNLKKVRIIVTKRKNTLFINAARIS